MILSYFFLKKSKHHRRHRCSDYKCHNSADTVRTHRENANHTQYAAEPFIYFDITLKNFFKIPFHYGQNGREYVREYVRKNGKQ